MMAVASNPSGQLVLVYLLVAFFHAVCINAEAVDPTDEALCGNITNGIFLLDKIMVCS